MDPTALPPPSLLLLLLLGYIVTAGGVDGDNGDGDPSDASSVMTFAMNLVN